MSERSERRQQEREERALEALTTADEPLSYQRVRKAAGLLTIASTSSALSALRDQGRVVQSNDGCGPRGVRFSLSRKERDARKGQNG
ncbi:hypothetical protein DSM104299_00418 [Baekduia alba]|uniref:hypothetical protein n=1 Tax=Baekduia alba TaxID=2997333 RepID=UPI00234257DB|nr:hypothetical protein [Baekduia alba]WCB91742.1 hypothetical protein DSM104299_00418 [Baekduia alba]